MQWITPHISLNDTHVLHLLHYPILSTYCIYVWCMYRVLYIPIIRYLIYPRILRYISTIIYLLYVCIYLLHICNDISIDVYDHIHILYVLCIVLVIVNCIWYVNYESVFDLCLALGIRIGFVLYMGQKVHSDSRAVLHWIFSDHYCLQIQ